MIKFDQVWSILDGSDPKKSKNKTAIFLLFKNVTTLYTNIFLICATIKKVFFRQTDGNTHRHRSSNSSLDIYYTRFWTRNSDFFVWLRLIMRFKYVFNLVEILVTSFEAQRFFQNATIHQQCGNMGLPSLANNLGRKKDFRWQPQYNGFNVFLRLCF